MSTAPEEHTTSFESRHDGVLTRIEKRDGRVVPFDRRRIEQAIGKACAAAGAEDITFIIPLVSALLVSLESRAEEQGIALYTVEQIQDAVEEALMKAKRFDIAKRYILYREEQAQKRKFLHEELLKQIQKRGFLVQKRNGAQEVFDVKKIKAVFTRVARGYEDKCHFEDFLAEFKRNIVDQLATKDINRFMIKTAIDLVTVQNICWQHIAARLLLEDTVKQALKNRNLSITELYSASSYAALFDTYVREGLYYKDFYKYYSKEDIVKAGEHIDGSIDDTYEYTTILSLTKRYLLNPNGVVRELPQEMYMSVALFLAIPEKTEERLEYAFKIYDAIAHQLISLPTPTLLNSRTNYHQLSSCFKLNIDDDLRTIYHGIENIAQISKFGGGVGVYLGNIRSREASIRGVEKASGGVNPWIKVINDTAVAVNQLGARMGAVSVTLDIWHKDIYDFLDLQTETGDIRAKAFDIFPAVSIPDIFMRRMQEDGTWSLFDPHEVFTLYGKKLQDHFGEEFDAFYEKLEQDTRIKLTKKVSAKELFKKYLKTVVETGMPYAFFRDTVNRLNPNKHAGNVYSTQLCTEICQNTSPSTYQEETIEDGTIVIRYNPGDTVVCNLASINIAKVHDEETIKAVFPVMTRILDNVITLNYYPIKEAERTAKRYRSIGIGYLGLAEYLATRHINYDSQEARDEVAQLFERYGYHTYRASVDLARERGHYPLFPGSEYSKGVLLGRDKEWYRTTTNRGDEWAALFDDMLKYGTRFAYHTAPAPNTSTAGVVGTTAALLPIYKRYFIENNLSSPTIRVAPKLDKENFQYYKEYITIDMKDVIDLIAEIYKWVDQSISFEWMINPQHTSPADLYSYYIRSWEKNIKTIYYVRSLSADVKTIEQKEQISTESFPGSSGHNVCESCSG